MKQNYKGEKDEGTLSFYLENNVKYINSQHIKTLFAMDLFFPEAN